MRSRFGRPNHATVVAYLALFVALGGTAYAAATITGADVVDSSLTGADVKGASATSSSAAINGGLTGNDISGQPADAGRGRAAVNGSLTGYDISGQPAIAELGQPAVNGSLTTYDIADTTIREVDLAGNAVTSAKVKDNALLGADIDESTLDVVQGSGELVTNRVVAGATTSGHSPVLLELPGLGRLEWQCHPSFATVRYVNETAGPVDFWVARGNGTSTTFVANPSEDEHIVVTTGTEVVNASGSSTLSLGVGNDPGLRRVATLQVSVLQAGEYAPCGFQVQGTSWVSP